MANYKIEKPEDVLEHLNKLVKQCDNEHKQNPNYKSLYFHAINNIEALVRDWKEFNEKEAS